MDCSQILQDIWCLIHNFAFVLQIRWCDYRILCLLLLVQNSHHLFFSSLLFAEIFIAYATYFKHDTNILSSSCEVTRPVNKFVFCFLLGLLDHLYLFEILIFIKNQRIISQWGFGVYNHTSCPSSIK